MSDARRDTLRRAYLSLGAGELIAAGVFAAVAVTVVSPRLEATDRAALWSALVPLLAILVQAGMYWLLARTWVGRSQMPSFAANLYRVFRICNVGLLVGGLIGIVVWKPDQASILMLVTAVWLFGAVEYINYFVVRLAYPFRRWLREVVHWKKPRLVRDLTSGR